MPDTTFSLHQQLNTPYSLTKEQISFYQENRFIKLKQVFDESTILYFNEVITRRVEQMNTQTTPLESRST